mmetsp:Transcript_10853/g.19121  ORF Transcript_10853/g.19121 Transcript_10853/m.19121 type:complete len:215 (-) Transcript_10853:827-1471(-)
MGQVQGTKCNLYRYQGGGYIVFSGPRKSGNKVDWVPNWHPLLSIHECGQNSGSLEVVAFSKYRNSNHADYDFVPDFSIGTSWINDVYHVHLEGRIGSRPFGRNYFCAIELLNVGSFSCNGGLFVSSRPDSSGSSCWQSVRDDFILWCNQRQERLASALRGDDKWKSKMIFLICTPLVLSFDGVHSQNNFHSVLLCYILLLSKHRQRISMLHITK